MQDEYDKERLNDLCEKAAVESDIDKLLALIAQINTLLDAKKNRVKSKAATA